MPISTSFFDVYSVIDTSTDNVTLAITITELKADPTNAGQFTEVPNNDIEATTIVKLGTNSVGDPKVGSFNGFIIGKNNDLANLMITVTTSLADVNPDSNVVRLSYTLTGGSNTYTRDLLSGVLNQGDIVEFLATIRFY